MAGIVFGVFCLVSVVCAAVTGHSADVGAALFSGTEDAVGLMLPLAGAMCLWSGILSVFSEMGVTAAAERILSPILSRIFPACTEGEGGLAEITASLAANLLGLGNAATPIGLRAMEKLRRSRRIPGRMSRAEITFVLLNTAPPTLLPTTLLSLRHAAGSAAADAVLPAVWLVSLLGFAFAAALAMLWPEQTDHRKGGAEV